MHLTEWWCAAKSVPAIMTTDAIDVIVIGASPAGMAAATTAAKGGAKVLVLDDQRTFGGQIYRNVALAGTAEAAFLGDDYMAGQSVIREFCRQDLEFRAKATVWQVTEERQVGYSAPPARSGLRC